MSSYVTSKISAQPDLKVDKENKQEEQNVPIITLPPPPDGGWGWFIVFAGFMINFLGNGSFSILGIFLDSFVQHFETSYQSISIANSISYGVYMCSMPINSALINLFGCRKVCFVGSILFGLGFFLTTLSSNIYLFYLTYGVIMGWSCGFVMMSWMALVSFYFEKKRALANAICTCGSPIGAAIWSPVGNYLLRSYGWKTTFLVFGCINLLSCFIAFLLKPLELTPKRGDTSNEEVFYKDSNKSSPFDQTSKRKRTSSNLSQSYVQSVKCRRKSILGISQIQQNQIESKEACCIDPESRESTLGIQQSSTTNDSVEHNNAVLTPNERNAVSFKGKKSVYPGEPSSMLDNSTLNLMCIQLVEPSEELTSDGAKKRNSVMVLGASGDINLELRPVNDIFSRRKSSVVVRPFSRLDALYDRSISRLVSNIETRGNLDEVIDCKPDDATVDKQYNTYRHSIVSIPRHSFEAAKSCGTEEKNDRSSQSNLVPRGSIYAHHVNLRNDSIVDQDMQKEFSKQSVSVLDTMRTMLDTSYLKKPLFLVICLSRFFSDCAIYIPWNYMPSMMDKKEVDPSSASFLFIFLGLANLISRLGSGALLDHPKVTAVLVNTISTTVAGISFIFLPFCNTFETFAAVGSFYGLFAGGYVTSQSVVLVDMFGLESLVSSLGRLKLLYKCMCFLDKPKV